MSQKGKNTRWECFPSDCVEKKEFGKDIEKERDAQMWSKAHRITTHDYTFARCYISQSRTVKTIGSEEGRIIIF